MHLNSPGEVEVDPAKIMGGKVAKAAKTIIEVIVLANISACNQFTTAGALQSTIKVFIEEYLY